MKKVESNNSPKISIILPIYNAGKYLRPCLDTLVNQTMREIEIVCVLDCPTDGSDKIVQEYAEKDPRILVITNQHNLHIGESRNIGILAAHGEYIGFSDHDDTHELDMYESLYAATENSQKALVLSGKFVIETGLDSNSTHLIESCLKNILNRTSTAHITPHIFKRTLIEKNNIRLIDTKECPGEDIVFFSDFLCHLDSDKQISFVPRIFYHHTDTGHNTADSADYSSLQKVPLLVHRVYRLIQLSPYNHHMNDEMWTFLIQTTYTPFRNVLCKTGLIRTTKELKNIISKDEIYTDIADNCSAPGKRISLPKRLFAFWLKHIIKRNN